MCGSRPVLLVCYAAATGLHFMADLIERQQGLTTGKVFFAQLPQLFAEGGTRGKDLCDLPIGCGAGSLGRLSVFLHSAPPCVPDIITRYQPAVFCTSPHALGRAIRVTDLLQSQGALGALG